METTRTQKQIVVALDMLAENCWRTGKTPATGKQTWFLAGLLAKAGRDVDWLGLSVCNMRDCLSKQDASRLIDTLINDTIAA